jgi:hypothetical protein
MEGRGRNRSNLWSGGLFLAGVADYPTIHRRWFVAAVASWVWAIISAMIGLLSRESWRQFSSGIISVKVRPKDSAGTRLKRMRSPCCLSVTGD